MSGGGPGLQMPFMPGGGPQMDAWFRQMMGNELPWLQGEFQQIIPNLYSNANALQNNPYSGLMQQGANAASAWGMGTGANILQQGAQNLSGAGNKLLAQMPGVLEFSNDPQNALYNRTFQQTMDQANAASAAQGVSGSPYAANLAAQTASDFNLGWGNNQLQRMAMGDQTASGLAGSAGGAFGGAGQLAGGAMNMLNQAGQLPYAAYAAPYSQALNAWEQIPGAIGQIAGAQQGPMQDMLGYLNYGLNATQLMDQNQQTQWQDSQQVWNQLGQMFGPMLFGQGFGGGFGGGGQGQGGGGGNMAQLMEMLMQMFQFSDRRLKTDIERIGELDSGLPIYRYRFNGSPWDSVGVMADEVEQVLPEAVAIHPSGFKMVDYDYVTRMAA